MNFNPRFPHRPCCAPQRPCRCPACCHRPVVHVHCNQNNIVYNTPPAVKGTSTVAFDDGCVNCTDKKGTRRFKAANRDPFWPHFAKPRWLSCEQLYNQN